jgi:2-octaprenyl-3-methyl-6-methoxy-1,4-benzoquinol hydroxylase
MSRATYDAVVAGGGVVGATAALALAREGVRVALVEPAPPAPWRQDLADLRAYALAADSVALLDRLGAWASVRARRAQPYRRMRVWTAGSDAELDLQAQAVAQPQLGWIIEQSLLLDALWAALPGAGVDLHVPARVERHDEGTDGLRVQLDDGRSLRTRLLLAADGRGSPLREAAGIACDRRDDGQQGLVAYVRTEHPHQATAWQRFLPSGPLAFLPFADGRCSIVWTLPAAEAERLLAADADGFSAELSRALDRRLGACVLDSARAAFPLRRHMARQLRQGRLLLLGDAAHAVHPLAGQGVNLGLRDVAALVAVLAAARARGRALDADAPLQRWARTRRSEDASASFGFELINRVYSNASPLPTAVRGHALRLAQRMPGMAHALWRHASGG